MSERIGIIAIGRNEGERLFRCLKSVMGAGPVVYVDSGSSDGSVDLAKDLGATIVHLDTASPFTAARARNAGFERLATANPDLKYVQFIDGDCELLDEWLSRACDTLRACVDAAIVCGRVRERYRNRSIYLRLCDMEFNRQPGDVAACGGIFLARISMIKQVGAFDPSIIAGEEPEMCLRLRRAGHRIIRIDSDMCLHDSAISRFGQWWRRSLRSGYAYALGVALHGRDLEKHCVRESWSIWLWAIVPIAVSLVLLLPTGGFSAALLLIYPLQAIRIALLRRFADESLWDRLLFGAACVIAKWPQMLGQIRFLRERGHRRIIEYK